MKIQGQAGDLSRLAKRVGKLPLRNFAFSMKAVGVEWEVYYVPFASYPLLIVMIAFRIVSPGTIQVGFCRRGDWSAKQIREAIERT